MPVQTAPSLVYASSSTFAPDFGGDSMKCASKSTISPQRSDDRSFFIPSLNSAPGHSVPFDHHEIISSTRRTSESTDSSPTTTSSTFDTTSIADTSPSSSPESPSALQLPYLKSTRIAEITERLAMFPDASISASNPVPATSRPVSPGRRARNLKNLSLKVPGQISRPAISTASAVEVKSQNYSAPSSPVLRPAPKTGRRKPANLTIRTPASEQTTFARNIAGIIPPTPSVLQLPQRSLRRFDSSPSLSVFSPTAGPTNGMQLPRPTTQDGIPQMPGSWQDSPPLVQPQPEPNTSLQQVTEEDDYHLDSRESSKRAEKSYPDGPIKIYDSGVYLYLEPTKDEARNFDVVINVAKEVLNPFAKDKDPKPDTVVSSLRRPISLAKRLSMAEPMTAISEESFHSAFESLPSSESCSPTTPKTENLPKTPEYIHVPWDHNSEILDDLATLCQLVDDRINQGKTVLIHCQLGASRSASLVIAYGLYKNRELDFNDMYGIVKSKSQWVGPNMSLIYQLTDFRSRVQRDEPIKGPNPDWFETSNNISPPVESEQPTPFRSQNPSEMGSVFPIEKIKQTPPVLPEMIFSPVQNIFRTPFAKAFPPSQQSSHNSKARAPLPRPLPLREKYSNLEPSTKPNRREPRKLAHVRYPTVQMDLVMQDVPSSPSILSPRAAPYMCSSLSRTLAGDLAGDAPSPALKFGQSIFDPRSPPQRQELLITRSIDEVL